MNTEHVWGYDSEFNIEKNKVISLQFWRPGSQHFITSPEELDQFLRIHHPKIIWGFNSLCDIGSWELLTGNKWTVGYLGQMCNAYLKTKYGTINMRDIRPMCMGMGLNSLYKVGEYLGMPKLSRDALTGIAIGDGKDIDSAFIEYAMRDAQLTSMITSRLMAELKIDSQKNIYTPASFAKNHTKLKKTYEKWKGKTLIPKDEMNIRNFATYGGRNECFINGYLENYQYLDVVSLYPVSALLTQCLNIQGIKECELSDLNLNDEWLFKEYGWIYGTFKVDCDWGLPIRNNGQVKYVTGMVTGFYNTMDIMAAQAKIVECKKCFKAKFLDETFTHSKFKQLFFKKYRKEYQSEHEKLMIKLTLNSLTGKLAQVNPVISPHCNYPAYSALLAASHLIMSNLSKEYHDIAGMDTDSFFVPDGAEHGLMCEVDGYPIKLDVKQEATDLIYLRAKLYIFPHIQKGAYHSWKYGHEAFFDYWKNPKPEFTMERQAKRTQKTHEKFLAAKPLGWWYSKPSAVIKASSYFKCDNKRDRDDYDSYHLAINKEHGNSKPYIYGCVKMYSD